MVDKDSKAEDSNDEKSIILDDDSQKAGEGLIVDSNVTSKLESRNKTLRFES